MFYCDFCFCEFMIDNVCLSFFIIYLYRNLNGKKKDVELSRMQSCRIIGVDLNTEIILTDSISKQEIKLSDNTHDLTTRPEYRMLQKQVELKELNIKNVRSDYLPTIGLMAGYNYIGDLKIGGIAMKMNKPAAIAMISVSIPLFHFGEGHKKIKNAKIAPDIQQEELHKNSKLLTIERQHAERNLQDAFQLIGTAEIAFELTKANLDHARNNYNVKMGTLLDVLDAQAQWQEAYSNIIHARVQYKISEVEYLRAIGRL